MHKSKSGFTIVELLIVIVIIAILAAISVVAYTGIQNRAHDTTVQNDLSNLRKIFELSAIDNNGQYLYSNISMFKATKDSYSISPITTYNLVFCFSTGPGADYLDYGVVALSKSGKRFSMSKTEQVKEYTENWGTSAQTACNAVFPSFSNNVRGYAADDLVNGPWRDWVGGN